MIAAKDPHTFISRNYTQESTAENQRIIDQLFDEGKYNLRDGFKFKELHTKQSDGVVDGDETSTLPLSRDIATAKNIIQQYLATEQIALNDQELLGQDKGKNRNNLYQLFAKALHIHVWDDYLKKNPQHVRAQKLIEKYTNDASTLIDQNTQPKNYTGLNVYGDGHCWYYATLASLFHTIITGQITEDSETAARLRAPNGFFDQVKAIYERENSGKTMALQHRSASPESLKDSLHTILNVYNNNFYDCFAGVCAPALQTIIYNQSHQRQQFTQEMAVKFKEWLVNNVIGNLDPSKLDSNTAKKIKKINAKNHDELYSAYFEDAKKYCYNAEQKKDRSYVEGGAFQGNLLENILDIKIKSFEHDKNRPLPPADPTKPTLYVANTGGHFHAGLTHIQRENPEVRNFTQEMLKSIRPRSVAKTKPEVLPGNNTAATFGKDPSPKAVSEISTNASGQFFKHFDHSFKNDAEFTQKFSKKIGYAQGEINIEKDKDAYNVTKSDAVKKSEKLLLRVEPTRIAAYETLLTDKGPEATARALLVTFKESAPRMTEIIITTKNEGLRKAIEQLAAKPEFGLTVVQELSAVPGMKN